MRALAILLLTAFTASGAIITGPLQDISAGTYNTSGVEFWPLTTPTANGTSLVVGPKKSVQPTNGNFSVSLVAGRYLVKFLPTTNTVYIWVPNDSGTYTVANLATNASAVATVDQSPLYKVRISSTDSNQNYLAGKILPGSNVTFSTNATAGTITIASTGGGGSSFDPTRPTNYNGTFTGNGSALTNLLAAPTNVFPNAYPGGTRMRNGSLWYWFASLNSPDCMKIYVSADGMSWAAATTNTCDYQDPDYHTNNAQGPYSREVTVQYDASKDKFYGVYNYDPYNTNANSQALGIIESSNGTNWTRIGLIWPNGKTNGGGQTFAATWFTDDNGSNYLAYPHWDSSPAGAPNYFNFYVIRRLDNTYLNWSAPALVITNGMTDFTWDMFITKSNNQYQAWAYSANGGVGIATNSTGPQSTFTYSHTLWSGTDGAGEGPMLFKFSPLYWRLYSRGTYSARYIESLDGGASWSTRQVIIPYDSTFGGWHAPGILPPANPLLSLATAYPDTIAATKWGVYRSPSNTPAANLFLKSAGSTYTKWQGLTNESLRGNTVIDVWNSDKLIFTNQNIAASLVIKKSTADNTKIDFAYIDEFGEQPYLTLNYSGDSLSLGASYHYVGNGSGITNVYASNIVSGGQLPLGTVSSGLSSVAGPMLTTNGTARSYSFDGSALTNLNAASLASGSVPAARLNGVALSSNAISYATLSGITTNTGGWVGGLNMTNPATGSFVVVTNGGITAQAAAGYNILTNGVVALGANAAAAKITLDGVGGGITNSGNIQAATMSSSASFIPLLATSSATNYIRSPFAGYFGFSSQSASSSSGYLIGGFGSAIEFSRADRATPWQIDFASNGKMTAGGMLSMAGNIITNVSQLSVQGSVTATNGFVAIPTIGAGVALTSQGAYILSSSSQTITLPSAVTNIGKTIWIKNRNVTSTTVNTVSSQTIDGASTYSLPNAYSGRYFISDGANWLTDGVGL